MSVDGTMRKSRQMYMCTIPYDRNEIPQIWDRNAIEMSGYTAPVLYDRGTIEVR